MPFAMASTVPGPVTRQFAMMAVSQHSYLAVKLTDTLAFDVVAVVWAVEQKAGSINMAVIIMVGNALLFIFPCNGLMEWVYAGLFFRL